MENYLHGLLDEADDKVITKYLEYIDNGIPVTNKKKKVVIIGAGMAGMVAAAMLKGAGHDVTIVEANMRVGGRIKTFRNTAKKKYFEDDSLYCEAGAMRLPTIHKMVFKYISKLNLKKEPFYYVSVDKKQAIDYKKGKRTELPDKNYNSLLFVNYRKVVQKDYNASTDVSKLLDYNLETKPKGFENQQASKLLSGLMAPLKNFIAEDPQRNWPKLIERFGNYSMFRFLKEQSMYSDNAIEMIAVLQNLESRLAYDFIQSFIESNVIKDDTEFWQIVGGTDELTTAFFKEYNLKENTCFNLRVTKLWKNEKTGKVRVTTNVEEDHNEKEYKDRGFELRPRPDKVEFDEVIVTIPFSAFRQVHVWPAFSQEKRKAIRELHYDSATKVLLEFRERWWEQAPYNIVGGGTITDMSNRFVYYPSQDIGKKGNGLILASYVWSDEASRWDSMGDMDRYTYALDNIAVMHAPDDLAEQKRIKSLAVLHKTRRAEKADKSDNSDPGNIIGGATQSWMQDPYAFGEAAIFNPGQLHLLQKHIVSTEWDEKAHFAGEHASLKHAWIEGAIESGIRAALEVNETPVYLND